MTHAVLNPLHVNDLQDAERVVMEEALEKAQL
jgi:hypothetical protein